MPEQLLTKSILHELRSICLQTATFQMNNFHLMEPGAGDEKKRMELVSFVDLESEQMIHKELTRLAPNIGFFGEETGRSGDGQIEWIVDPLDGTTNFLSGIDHFSISIALVKQGEPLMGIVHRPSTKESFMAIKGQGAWLNDKQLSKKTFLEASRSLIATGFPYRSEDIEDDFYACSKRVLRLGRGIRRMGSAAMDLAYISAGYLQGYWESDLQAYDIAAGMVLLEETGCACTNQNGESYNIFEDRMMVCGFPGVYEPLLKIVQESYKSL
jgi:myo-inositol-1(or 4)-monophosphatase